MSSAHPPKYEGNKQCKNDALDVDSATFPFMHFVIHVFIHAFDWRAKTPYISLLDSACFCIILHDTMAQFL